MITRQNLQVTIDYVKRDYQSWPLRFSVEMLAWFASLISGFIMSVTLPNPPWVPLYCVWVCCTAMFAWSAWTRGSVGMMSNFILLNIIDTIGLIRAITP